MVLMTLLSMMETKSALFERSKCGPCIKEMEEKTPGLEMPHHG
jgi:hypothetical protein